MADLFLGLDVGDSTADDVATGSSTTSKTIELRVAAAATPLATRQAVLEALDALKQWFSTQPYTP